MIIIAGKINREDGVGMKIYIADSGETLKIIAHNYRVDLNEMMIENPHIVYSDQNIGGSIIKIPSSVISSRNHKNEPQFVQKIGSDAAADSVNACPPQPPVVPLDNWIPLTPLETMEKTDYDVVIIGSGAGGGAVLWRLCEQWRNSGKRVCVLEAGDLLLQDHIHNLPTFNVDRIRRYLNNPKYAVPIGEDIPEYPGAKLFLALGGKTIHWGGISPRLQPIDFINWPITYNDLVPYYLIAERIMNVNLGYTSESSLQKVLLERLSKIGYGSATAQPRAVDLQITKFGNVHSSVFFSSILFMSYCLNLRGFDLAVRAPVIEVLTEKGKAVGVKVVTPEKKVHYIKGKTIVLSAGAFQNPRILFNSGIQGEAIGRYLINHSFVTIRPTTNRDQFPENLGVLGILIPRSKEMNYQVQLNGPHPYEYYHYQEEPLMKELQFSFSGYGVIEPRRDNYIYLDPAIRDEYGLPKINIHFSYSERDWAVIRQMATAITDMIPRIGLTMHGKPCLMPPGIEYHESGTCRMGDNQATSVTNRYCQMHNISGLYVADTSVLPSIGAANPTLTTVAVAIRTADYIIQQLS